MATPKKFFHDHWILLLLSVNAFLALALTIVVLLRLGSSHSTGYIVQYRPSLGIGAFKTGSVTELLSFIGFSALVLITHTILAMRAYHVRRQMSVAILSLGVLLQLLAIVISNALLALR
ncbi:MAG: hypothetical protein QFB87_00125 [Patescibacteria group bacterium]|nr:hypothetical protein [Patescibacteria group bacterium]